MALDVNTALTKAYDELRTIDMDLSSLSGVQDRFNRKRTATGDFGPSSAVNERRVQDGGRKIIVGPESSVKRGRFLEDQGRLPQRDERDYSPPSSRTHRTLSSVVMPTTIETKSRTAIINEKKKSENKDDLVRNRRLFSNLLVGTLRQFQKEEKTVGNKGQAQIEKQREVERRLEETEKENRERLLRERDQLMAKRREKEIEIQALRRQKAIEQSAEEKMKHFRRLACFIQTQTKLPLFFLPAKHSLRTLELLKESSRKIETLIEMRREEMNKELKRLETYIGGAEGNNAKDDSDHEENLGGGLKSAVVVKTEQPQGDEEKSKDDDNGAGGGSEYFNQDDNGPNNNGDKNGQNANEGNDSGELNYSMEAQDDYTQHC